MKEYINHRLLEEERNSHGDAASTERYQGISTYQGDLKYEAELALEPLKSLLKILMQSVSDNIGRDGGVFDGCAIDVLESVLENTEQRLSTLLGEVNLCVGPISLNMANFKNPGIKGRTVVSVKLDLPRS